MLLRRPRETNCLRQQQPRGNMFAHPHGDSFRGTSLCSGSSPAASLPQQLLSSRQDNQELPGLERRHNCPLRERHRDQSGRQAARSVCAPPAFPDCEVGRFCTYVLAHTCFCSNLDSQNSCSASKSSGFQVNPPHSNPGPVLWLQSGTGGRGTSDDLTAIPMGSQQPVCQRHLTNRKEKQSFYFCSVPSLANPVMCLITITF